MNTFSYCTFLQWNVILFYLFILNNATDFPVLMGNKNNFFLEYLYFILFLCKNSRQAEATEKWVASCDDIMWFGLASDRKQGYRPSGD